MATISPINFYREVFNFTLQHFSQLDWASYENEAIQDFFGQQH